MVTATARPDRLAGLYAIADLPHPAGLDPVALALALLGERPRGGPGPAALQLRAKRASTAERLAWLAALAPACRDAGVLLVINDDVDAALASDAADALHIGQEDLGEGGFARRRARLQELRERAAGRGRSLQIGLSTHGVDQVREALALEVDYIGFGPIFATRSKERPDPTVGLEGLTAAAALVRGALPIIAIGGLDEARAVAAIRAGASGAALISALHRADASATRAAAAALGDLLVRTYAERAQLPPGKTDAGLDR
ncbi:MAG: thiamine phosphate synthase [Myxococcales bacterium]|nr:thiamine phosphate synthase [Myxococcales bacterium]MCB9704512.1 thiamine phosphate synthase [Myxococcales bacterium]